MLKKQINIATSNPIGLIAGAGLTFWAMRKYAPSTSMLITTLGVIAGGVIGANLQSTIVAKKGAISTADTAKK